ncbi:hypothetical protein Dimus_008319 [Dionaea muscipula]
MENSNLSKNRGNEHLGVNKMGKTIRKSPLHQPNYVNSNSNQAGKPQPQPQIYTISKNDFRSFVQQHTGSPAREPLPRPPSNPPRPTSVRLQRIRPPPLTPMNRFPVAPVATAQALPVPHPCNGLVMPPAQSPYANNVARPPQFGQPSPREVHPLPGAHSGWVNPALSPISAYMQQLQTCINDSGHRPAQGQLHSIPQIPSHVHAQNPPTPQFLGHACSQWPSSASGPLPSPSMPPVLSPRMRNPGLLTSPTSQLPFPSPSSFLDLWTPPPRSPYLFPSPGSQFPPPLSPNFSFAPMSQSGVLGPGALSPLSPGAAFPLSPSRYFPVSSPRWRAQ